MSAPATPLLEIRQLTVRFGGLLAVDALDLEVRAGEVYALVGPNGAGKTTVLNCISGFTRPTSGSITLRGVPLLPLNAAKRAALGIGRTFQNVQLFASMTVLENLLTAQHAQLRAGVFAGVLPFGTAPREDQRARERARETMARLGLEPYADAVVSALSFGIQQMVGVARALILHPQLLLLDEPAAGVPQQGIETLGASIRQWRDELGMTILLIEHNMSLVQAVADTVCVLDYGETLACGTPREVLTQPAVLEAYLGRGDSPVADGAEREEREHAEG